MSNDLVNTDLDILFLGGLFPKERENEIVGHFKKYTQNAANVLQHEIVDGLETNCPGSVRVLNALFVGSYPNRYGKLLIKKFSFSHVTGADDLNIGYLNLIGLSKLSKYFALIPHVRRWASEHEHKKKKVIIAYAATQVFASLLRYAKKINDKIITCMIIPDLPVYMNPERENSFFYRRIKEIETKQVFRDMSCLDCFVLLTEHMKDVLCISVPFVVMEGIASDHFSTVDGIPKDAKRRTVLYSGALTVKNGIVDLIEAFKRLPECEYRLVLCGEGDAEDFIKDSAEKDPRIIFKGLLSRNEVLKLQRSSTVLVNPRSNKEEFTKYSFPSKLIEYMSSGTPVITYKLAGIPHEYFEYLYVVDDKTDALFSKLEEVMIKSENELFAMGSKARDFVLSNKSAVMQTAKIINMIQKMIG